MNSRIAAFELIPFEQFLSDFPAQYGTNEYYGKIKLPLRATAEAAGYDFFMPYSVSIKHGESLIIPTGIRVKIDAGWFLGVFPRSGLGFKYGVTLSNTVGIIDGDYYYADNCGHIMIKLSNRCYSDSIVLEAGKAFAQGIFMQYGITYNDEAQAKRTGGFGSTSL